MHIQNRIKFQKTTDCKFVPMEFSRSSVMVTWVGTVSKTSVTSHWIFLIHKVMKPCTSIKNLITHAGNYKIVSLNMVMRLKHVTPF